MQHVIADNLWLFINETGEDSLCRLDYQRNCSLCVYIIYKKKIIKSKALKICGDSCGD